MAIQRNLTTVPTRTVAGSYEAPVEGIVDYSAFGRGLEKGIAPGIEFAEEQKRLDEEAKKIKLDTSVDVFTGINKNAMTGDQDLKTNTLLQDDAVLAMSNFRPEYIEAYKKNDQKKMNAILSQIGDVKSSYSNLSSYVNRLGDPEINDGNVSNTKFINENGDQIDFNGVDFTNLNNNNPKNIRQGSKVNANGQVKQGFFVIKDGKQVFLNTQDMDEAYLNRNFKLKADQQRDINASISKDGVNAAFNRTPTYNVAGNKTVDIVNEDGTIETVSVGDSTKYIRPEFYQKSEDNAKLFANDEYSNQNDSMFESSWNQFTNDTKFVSAIKGVGDYKDPRVAAKIPDNIKIAMLKDYAAEKWKITIANAGYVEGNDGRALSKNVIQYRSDRGVTEKPVTDTGTATTSFMEDIFSKFNDATSGAEDYLKDREVGSKLTGQFADQTRKLIVGKEYNGKKISDIEYEKIGENQDGSPIVTLQVFTQEGDKEIPQPKIELTSAESRKEFLEDLAVSKFGLSKADEIAEAYTNIQNTRQEVQRVFGIYSDKLKNAIINNSSEGLNREQRIAFLMAGYGNKK
jgi:hypothetical protein